MKPVPSRCAKDLCPLASPQVLGRLAGPLSPLDALGLVVPSCSPLPPAPAPSPSSFPLPGGFSAFGRLAPHGLLFLWWDVVPPGGVLRVGGAGWRRALGLLGARLCRSGHQPAGGDAWQQRQAGLPPQPLLHQLGRAGQMTLGGRRGPCWGSRQRDLQGAQQGSLRRTLDGIVPGTLHRSVL